MVPAVFLYLIRSKDGGVGGGGVAKISVGSTRVIHPMSAYEVKVTKQDVSGGSCRRERERDFKVAIKLASPADLHHLGMVCCVVSVSQCGPIWEHVLTYWRPSLESPDNILFLKYEEMKMQPEVELRKLAAFMGKPFTVEEEERWVVAEIVKLCSFKFLSSLDLNKNIMVSKNFGSSL
nr:cytosolic sulfotransferase 5-like [Tanacetum cinerariifolium]